MAEKNLDDLFHDTLKDIYYAERKILAALPKMAKAAQAPELKAAFEKHRDQTEAQVERLIEVFGIIDKKPQGKTCPAIDGILEEGAEIMKDYKGTAALDAGLIGAAQRVEHYEMAAYGTARAFARALGQDKLIDLLQTTLDEEGGPNKHLQQLAEGAMSYTGINEKALAASIIPAAAPSRMSLSCCGIERKASAGSAPSAVAANAAIPPISAIRTPGGSLPARTRQRLSPSRPSTTSSASPSPVAAARWSAA